MRADMRSKITFRTRLESLIPNNALYPSVASFPYNQQDSYGEELDWADFQTVWGSVEPILGRELFAAETVNSNVQIKFRCYYFEGPNERMRIRYNNKEYDILSAVNVKNLNHEWLFYCKRVEG